MPEFSVVMPLYNRERLVVRALQSCLAQEGTDFEVIVVDDGSTDGSAAAVESLRSPVIKLLRHEINRGEVAARNTGVHAASGDWIVMLDSDDELLPGALSRISQIARERGASVERLCFMYRRDDGGVSPFPPLRDEILDYSGFLRSLEGRSFFDFLRCTRRFTFDRVPAREWRMSGYMLYSLDFARTYRTFFSSEILALVHTDAPTRLSWDQRKRRFAFQAGTDLGEEMDVILSRHGAALQQFAPRTFQGFQRVRASYYFMTGSVWPGVQQSMRCLRAAPLCAETWIQLMFGLTGPWLFARLRSLRPPPT